MVQMVFAFLAGGVSSNFLGTETRFLIWASRVLNLGIKRPQLVEK